jgi:hypothetical protein
VEGTITCGLELLHIVFTIRDHAHLVSTMQEHISCWPGGFLENALRYGTQDLRRREQPSDRDQKQEQRDPLPFKGDSELHPPLAWTWMWRGTYSNLYGEHISDAVRHWGYIMWDEARLDCTSAKEVLAQQLEREDGDWEDGNDPRNYI